MKNFVITGVSSGIGRALCKILTEIDGVKVLGVSRNASELNKLKDECGSSFDFIAADLLEVDAIISEIKNKMTQIDVLINNAGYLVNKSFEDLTQSDHERSYRINVIAPALMIQGLLPMFHKDVLGQVLNISSMGGVQGVQKFPGLGAYSPSKMALIGLTECLAEEYKEKNIHFNTLALGAVNTPMLQEAFPGYVAEVSPEKMALYIKNFILTQAPLMNGKTVQVALTTP